MCGSGSWSFAVVFYIAEKFWELCGRRAIAKLLAVGALRLLRCSFTAGGDGEINA
jgi:hypothetical protein